MKDDSRDESIPQFLGQPRQVSGIVEGRGRSRLDLNSNNKLPGQFKNNVHFMTTILISQM